MTKICLDTGVISQFFSPECNPDVNKIRIEILNKNHDIYVLKSVLCECYYHICKKRGKDVANVEIANFIRNYSPILVDLDESLIMSVGLLKCQHSSTLSYIDCMSIAFCLTNKITFYTTEQKLKDIPNITLQKLSYIKFQFE